METIIKHFTELTLDELYEMLKLRSAVFVVEQNCVYQDLDDYDKDCWLIFFRDDSGIAAYMRVLDKGRFEDVSFGRVISAAVGAVWEQRSWRSARRSQRKSIMQKGS